MNESGPHEFAPVRRLLNRGRCRHCFFHRDVHPIIGWVRSRPLHDRSPATKDGKVRR